MIRISRHLVKGLTYIAYRELKAVASREKRGLPSRSGDGDCSDIARVRVDGPGGQGGEDDADGLGSGVGRGDVAGGAYVAEGAFGAAGTAVERADGETESARGEAGRVVIRDHEKGGLRFHCGAGFVEEFA
jgi:hypothetical protein